MSTTEEQIAEANDLGNGKGRHLEAEQKMLEAADKTDNWKIRAECLQQAGVYATIDGRPEEALWHFDKAREWAREIEDTVLLGSIARDEAKAEADLGEFWRPFTLINEAFERHKGNQRELLMDEAFYGILICRRARQDRNKIDLTKGIFHLEEADRGFRSLFKQGDKDAGNLELYNMLHLAYWLSRAGMRRRSHNLAAQAFVLINMGYGNHRHRRRAQLLAQPIIGGWWLEDLAKQAQKLQRKLRH